MGLKRLVNAKLDNKVLVDKDEVNKDKAENHIIASLVTLQLQLSSFLV